ncbi:hypothetical protein [Streptacidiphilus rugosus]|uniref:hypothetical protein n=1 Tax=Streptacidiphilus rugosus TaxID=405783 RepID=UPI0012F74050|nr:hypothetical protein [Streptacidiphilus rugosus]
MEDSTPYHLWLAAIDTPVPEAEMRWHWRIKDDPTPVLDAALTKAVYFYLGTWTFAHDSEQPQSARCPALRIADWLFWRGTTPEYTLPTLDLRLSAELTERFQPRADDLPAVAGNPTDFTAFLAGHHGHGVLSIDADSVPQEYQRRADLDSCHLRDLSPIPRQSPECPALPQSIWHECGTALLRLGAGRHCRRTWSELSRPDPNRVLAGRQP